MSSDETRPHLAVVRFTPEEEEAWAAARRTEARLAKKARRNRALRADRRAGRGDEQVTPRTQMLEERSMIGVETATPPAGDESPEEQPQRARRGGLLALARRWWWLVLLVLLLTWWGVSRLGDADRSPGQLAAPSAPATVGVQPAAPGSVTEAQTIAQRYEALLHDGDVEGTCALSARPGPCRAGFGTSPKKYEMSEPVHVVQAETVTIPAGVGTTSEATAVLTQFTIKGQQARQVVLLVQGGKVTKRVTVGQKDAGRSLADLVKES